MTDILTISSISQFHELLALPSPVHPLISLVEENDAMKKPEMSDELFEVRFTTDLYAIMFKDKISGSIGYGRNSYDYQEGTLIFSSPGQVFTSPSRQDVEHKQGWTLLVHPDLFARSTLGAKIGSYSYFSYAINEALHLSEKEQKFVYEVVRKIQEEYSQNIDQHSQNLILSNLELLLNYCLRFYDRQFYTRTNLHQDIVIDFERKLKAYFDSEQVLENGVPATGYFGTQLNLSGNYLSDLLKKETGKSTKEHIDTFVVNRAKHILLNSNRSISEIAYGLGYEYPQSFTRLFKRKTGVSPLEFRTLN